MAIALIGSGVAAGGSTNGVTSGAYDTTGAKFIVVAAITYALGGTTTVSDSKSNTWTALTKYTTGTQPAVQFFYCASPTVGSGHTFTVSNTGGFPSICVMAFSGVKLSSPFDSGQDAGNHGSGTSLATGSVTPSRDNCLVVTVVGFDSSQSGPTVNSGFASPAPLLSNYSAGVHMGGAMSYLIETTATAKNPTWTLNSATIAAAVAVFLPNGDVSETISLGVTAGLALLNTAQALGSVALGAGAATTPGPSVARADVISPGVSVGTSTAPSAIKRDVIAPGVALDVAFDGQRSAQPQPVTIRAAVGVAFAEDITFGQTRRGTTAVVVRKASGKVTIQ